MNTRPSLPDGLRIYAIGDIHGRYDLLQTLAARIRSDIEKAPPRSSAEIYVGDYIDRGPQSREVVEWLVGTPSLADRRICLKGNHEAMLLSALADPAWLHHWLSNGAGTTLASYGLGSRELAALPRKHLDFYENLELTASIGSYLFVHAGIRPSLALADQNEEDLVWIREPFLSSDADHGAIVVHGHTPVDVPEVRPNRINIDTGAVFSGHLTCLVLEGTSQRFLTDSMR